MIFIPRDFVDEQNEIEEDKQFLKELFEAQNTLIFITLIKKQAEKKGLLLENNKEREVKENE